MKSAIFTPETSFVCPPFWFRLLSYNFQRSNVVEFNVLEISSNVGTLYLVKRKFTISITFALISITFANIVISGTRPRQGGARVHGCIVYVVLLWCQSWWMIHIQLKVTGRLGVDMKIELWNKMIIDVINSNLYKYNNYCFHIYGCYYN